MEIQKATGVVLSSMQLAEADKLARVYTKEFGKRSFLFKGIRKSRKRPQIVTEPGTIVNLLYYFHSKRDLYIVTEVNEYKSYSAIRDDLERILHLYFILEITDKSSGYNDTNRTLFTMLAAGINTLSSTDHVNAMSLFFLIHLLMIHGIFHDFNRCKFCENSAFNEFRIDISDFRPVCSKCSGLAAANGTSFLFNKRHRDIISQYMNKKFTSVTHSGYTDEDLLNILFYLK